MGRLEWEVRGVGSASLASGVEASDTENKPGTEYFLLNNEYGAVEKFRHRGNALLERDRPDRVE